MKQNHRTAPAIFAVCLAVGLMSSATPHAGVLNPAPTAATGQTTSYGPGDDGDLQKGVDWPGPRFTDNLDGTVTDHLTGLVWLKDATRLSPERWFPALDACSALADDGVDLTDGSVAGDWRLPNARELRRLIDFGQAGPALQPGHPFIVPDGGSYWTSTSAMNNTNRAWRIDDGLMLNDQKNTLNNVWPVRDGAEVPGPAPVPRTGQSTPYGERDDGMLQKGVDWPDPRFTDNLDGTVTDNLTGLTWLQNAIRFPDQSWAGALAACNALAADGVELADGSAAGAWRLPNVWEFGSLTDFGEIGPALPAGHPFLIENADIYWTGTTTATNANRAWTIGTGIGKISDLPKGTQQQVWPVRGGKAIPLDIKPGSCPNPLNFTSRGKLPVAILGTADLDVTTIDPATIRLEGVAPIRSSIEDVGTPSEPLHGREDCDLDCAAGGPDGWLDLTLKFKTQDIVAALGEAPDRECRVLTLTGHLIEDLGSAPIEGEDVVRILNHGSGGPGEGQEEGDEEGDGGRTERPLDEETRSGGLSDPMQDDSGAMDDPVPTTDTDSEERNENIRRVRRQR